MKTLTYEDIKPHVAAGLVTEQGHPENDRIRIFNYTPECQFSRQWNDVTIQCRGLIMNIYTNEVIARPFPKFFNYSEHIATGGTVPLEEPTVYEKMDGSLGILYWLNGQPWIATRGSFTSDQALWATKWWRENMSEFKEDGWTHLFEIIYPENRIVVAYDFSGLVYLASIDRQTGAHGEMTWVEPMRVVNKIPLDSLDKLLEMDSEVGEGYVLHFPVNDLRLKIKFATYVKLHKVMTGLSEKGIWELLQKKGIDTTVNELVEDVPDEFFEWMDGVVARLQREYYAIRDTADLQYAAIVKKLGNDASRKEWAELIKTMERPEIGFAMLDGKPSDKHIFKLIRPRGHRTFAVDEC